MYMGTTCIRMVYIQKNLLHTGIHIRGYDVVHRSSEVSCCHLTDTLRRGLITYIQAHYYADRKPAEDVSGNLRMHFRFFVIFC